MVKISFHIQFKRAEVNSLAKIILTIVHSMGFGRVSSQ